MYDYNIKCNNINAVHCSIISIVLHFILAVCYARVFKSLLLFSVLYSYFYFRGICKTNYSHGIKKKVFKMNADYLMHDLRNVKNWFQMISTLMCTLCLFYVRVCGYGKINRSPITFEQECILFTFFAFAKSDSDSVWFVTLIVLNKLWLIWKCD